MTLLLLALLQVAATPDAPLAEADRRFLLGGALATEADTAGAVAAWESALATGWASAAAERNLGAVALARGDAGRARHHLDRAARLAPLDADLAAARERAYASGGVDAPSPLGRLWAVVTLPGPLALVALALALILVAAALTMQQKRRAGRLAVGVASVAVLVAAGALAEASRPTAVVVSTATVREAPSPDAPEVGPLAVGTRVALGEAQAGWRAVRGDGVRGWVWAGALVR